MSQSKLVKSISVPSKLVASALVASKLAISKMPLLIWNSRFSMQCNFIQFYSRLFINMITFNMIQWKEFISSKLMHYGIFVQFRFWIKIQYLLEVTRRKFLYGTKSTDVIVRNSTMQHTRDSNRLLAIARP